MQPITSTHNARIKQARSLHERRVRAERRQLLLEGHRFIREALGAGAQVCTCFYCADRLSAADQELLAQLEGQGVELVPVTAAVLVSLSDTTTPQPLIAVAAAPSPAGREVLRPGSIVLVADQIADPGNLGTMLRTAAAIGAGMMLTKGTTDPTSPKVVRGSAGACYAVPLWVGVDGPEAARSLSEAGFRIVVCDMDGPLTYYRADLTGSVAVVVGNEGSGPQECWAKAGAELVHIPMPGRVESLNAGVAAAIVLYEALRQRIASC